MEGWLLNPGRESFKRVRYNYILGLVMNKFLCVHLPRARERKRKAANAESSGARCVRSVHFFSRVRERKNSSTERKTRVHFSSLMTESSSFDQNNWSREKERGIKTNQAVPSLFFLSSTRSLNPFTRFARVSERTHSFCSVPDNF